MTYPDQPPSGPPSAMPVAPTYAAPQEVGPVVERPASVTRAVQLMYAGAALSLVGIVVAWATKSSLRDTVATATPSLSASELDTAVTIALTVATVVGLVGVGLWLWMAAANNAGRSWARIVATVFGGLNVVSTLYSLVSSAGPAIILNLLSVALAVVILVLLWRPASSEYYRSRSARRG
ncbi:hypothetical protein Cch01nite_00760 [Cellulomonas chitinilytica]|uniref:Uncharacterized protein n=1 Tax=Cellulomonas chitinilytica TaxID=398759 RepID=A0A919NZH5_9CELL|nr:hypothetical protein [Cellulomonas chitinilytica]GIG19352.1 hypothetical protein Cch01nite_00760 [Cellulomonas chitinilytica]